MSRIWIDIISPSEAFFFASVLPHLGRYHTTVTAADSAETISLLQLLKAKHQVLGKHPTATGPSRNVGTILRALLVSARVSAFDIALSFADFYAALVAIERGKPSVIVTDNDKTENVHYRMLTLRRSRAIICPDAIPESKFTRMGIDSKRITKFPGYKEDIYLADYIPVTDFKARIPFEQYVVLRPEALFASYVKEKQSIVPLILQDLRKRKINVVFLPRSKHEAGLVSEQPGVYVPSSPMNGLDLVWNSSGVITGSGSLAREAALLGVPAVSFFPGELLSVDSKLVAEGRIFHSRNSSEIGGYVLENTFSRMTLSDVRERSSYRRKLFLDNLYSVLDSCSDKS